MILVVALIIFGPRKLPELGKSLGQSLAQFRKASEDFKRTWEDEVEAEKRRLDSAEPFEPQTTPPYDGWDASNESSQAESEAASQGENPVGDPSMQEAVSTEQTELAEEVKQA